MIENMDVLWEQQAQETPAAYRAFVIYRDLGAQRSVFAAYRVYVERRGYSGAKPGAKRAPTQWEQWASYYRWLLRVRAYDAYLERRTREKAESEHTEELAAFQSRARKSAMAASLAGTLALEKSTLALRTIDPALMKPAEIAMLLRSAAATIETGLDAEAEVLGVRAVQEDMARRRKREQEREEDNADTDDLAERLTGNARRIAAEEILAEFGVGISGEAAI